jgi:uncharacterized protein (TIGR02099 family)
MTNTTLTKPSLAWRVAHRLYRLFWYSLVVAIILIAIGISLVRAFLPDVKSYRGEIEQLASRFLDQAVQIESMDARLDGLTPTFIFSGVHMLDKEKKRELIRFEQLRLGFDLIQSIRRGRVMPRSLTITGVNLGIVRRANGTLRIQGLDVNKLGETIASRQEQAEVETNELGEWFFERSRLSIEKSSVLWRDDQHEGKTIRFENVNFELRNDANRHQLMGRVTLPSDLGEDLEASVDFTGNILVPQGWNGKFYARGKKVQAKNWGMKPMYMDVTLQQGELDMQVWGEWTALGLYDLSGNVTASDLKFTSKLTDEPFTIKLVNGVFDWRHGENSWDLRVDNFSYQQSNIAWPATRVTVKYQKEEPFKPLLFVHASSVGIEDIKTLLIENGLLDKKSHAVLNELQPKGQLEELLVKYRLDSSKDPELIVGANFKNLSSNAWQRVPGVAGLNGSILLDAGHGEIKLTSTSAALTFPGLFRQPIPLTQLQTAAQWWHAGDAWYINVPQLLANNADLKTDSSIYMAIPDNKASPYLDLQTTFTDGNVKGAAQFYPAAIMSKNLVNWLDSGLVAGKIARGGAVMHGRLRDFPYRNDAGTFQVQFSASDVELNYQKGWPPLHKMQLTGDFSATGMQLTSPQANLFDSQLRDLDVTIEDFSNSVLRARGRYSGSTQDVIHFLADSPIAPDAKDFYTKTTFAGQSEATIKLQIPLSERVREEYPLEYNGKVTFNNSAMTSWQGMLDVKNMQGELEYSPDGVFAENISAEIFEGKSNINVFTFKQAGSQQIKIGMQGKFDLGEALQHFSVPGAELIQGKTQWQGLLSFGYRVNGKAIPGSFTFGSDLQGVALDLPAPFGKEANEAEHCYVQVEFPKDNRFLLTAGLGDRLRTSVVLEKQEANQVRLHKAAISFSSAEPVLPQASAIKISGRLVGFAPDAWQAVLANTKSSKGPKQNLTRGILPMELDMDYLSLLTGDKKIPATTELPENVPLLNGQVRELVVDTMRLGKFEIASERDKDGILIKKVNFSSADMKIQGNGSWYYRKRKHQTNMVFNLDSPDVGNMMHQLGYAGIVRYGDAKAVMQVNWADAPNQFDFNKLNGTVSVVINNGSISQVDPGAGRVLGLLSLSELPRHLFLNFKELGSGFNFDSIQGSFDITNGDAVTKNLNVDSSVAVVALRGRTGFGKRDYDLDITAVPRATNTLPVIAFLLSGGQAGTVTWIFERIFGKKIDDSLAKRYTISGTWEKPLFTEVKSEASSQAATPSGANE